MTVAKVWDGSQWVTIQGVPGPQGAQGPIGLTGPQGAPGEIQKDSMPVIKKVAAGIPSTRGSITTTVEAYDAAIRDMRLGPFTPSQDCWLEVSYKLLLFPADAAWVRMDGYVQLMANNTDDTVKPDADNVNIGYYTITVWNNSAGVYYAQRYEAAYKLQAGQTYWTRLLLARQSGTWSYYVAYFQGHAKIVGFW